MLNLVAENIWEVPGDVWMPMGFHFPCRMTVIRLENDQLLLHSPISVNDNLAAELKKLGEVKYLIAPNTFHHLFLADVMARYPEAILYGAPGLEKKRKDLNFHHQLGEAASPWTQILNQKLIEGMPAFNEFVFFHKPGRTLIVTDFMFNIKQPRNLQSGLLYLMAGTYKKPGQSRLFRMMARDKAATGASVRAILKWDIQRVVMAHGQILEENAHAVLEKAVAKMASW